MAPPDSLRIADRKQGNPPIHTAAPA